MPSTLHPSRQLAPLLVLALGAACAAPAAKPVYSAKAEQAARPQLEAWLTAAVGGEGKAVRLLEAEQFMEGHTYETWRLLAEVGGKEVAYSLKVYPTEARAKQVADLRAEAIGLGWPVPERVAGGMLTPYKQLPGSLRVFVHGESLALKVRAKVQTGTSTGAIAALYGQVARRLGALHAKGRRPRKPEDRTAAEALKAFAERCQTKGWCSKETAKACTELAGEFDPPDVTFLHGDLYEGQIIFDESGELAAIVDLDEAGWGDPAADVGTLLAHVMLVNPVARKAEWGVADPDKGEVRATAEAVLSAYREGAGIGDDWAAFLGRVRGHMRLRVVHLLDKLEDNPHGKTLVDALRPKRRALLDADPFADYGLTP